MSLVWKTTRLTLQLLYYVLYIVWEIWFSYFLFYFVNNIFHYIITLCHVLLSCLLLFSRPVSCSPVFLPCLFSLHNCLPSALLALLLSRCISLRLSSFPALLFPVPIALPYGSPLLSTCTSSPHLSRLYSSQLIGPYLDCSANALRACPSLFCQLNGG